MMETDDAPTPPWLEKLLDTIAEMFCDVPGGITWDTWQEVENGPHFASVYPLPCEVEDEDGTTLALVSEPYLDLSDIIKANLLDETHGVIFGLTEDGPALSMNGKVKGEEVNIFMFTHPTPDAIPYQRYDRETHTFTEIPEDELQVYLEEEDSVGGVDPSMIN